MNIVDLFGPLVVIVVMIAIVISVYLRQGRNRVLEEIVEHGKIGPIDRFRGTLAIEENHPNFLLRLRKNSEGQRLQFLYRWVIGVGPQAIFDEVTFDGSLRSVELTRKSKHRVMPFSDFSAVRMREAAGKDASAWHVELVPLRGRCLLFLSSEREDRQTGFERTAPVVKAVSAIMSLPAQVVLDGRVWTRGWPPRRYAEVDRS